MKLVKNLRKYARYVLDTRSFAPAPGADRISDHALEAARAIRGVGRGPAIMLHGVTKRSGTGYVGHLLWLHPDVSHYPNRIWEVPFLALTGDLKGAQEKFFAVYEQNAGKMGDDDFLPLFGASLVGYFYAWVPQEQRLLLKTPGVQYLDHFYSVFPHEQLLVLVRDGRDVVTSTVKAWPQIRFIDACRFWDRSARMVLACHERFAGRPGYWMVRYEDVVRDPAAFAGEACTRFGLDESRYPYADIDAIPVHGSSFFRQDGTFARLVRKPLDFNPVGRWEGWSAWRKWTFKRVAGHTLVALGYCEDLSW